jgi:ADP-ribose pyrophosphatase YjhB (NUDIX family)
MTSMNFCSQCGAKVTLRIPTGDHLPRHVCGACDAIHYLNPRLVVGCVPELDGRILICKRAIDPRRGFWAVPAGFLENGETLQQGAAREAREEALADVAIGSLLAVATVMHTDQIHVFFRGRLRSAQVGAGEESLEVMMARPEDIPWSELAFPSTEFALRHYLEDRATGNEAHHFVTFDRRTP